MPAVPPAFPEQFDVRVYPASSLSGRLRAQPSKNYTTRYLLGAALSPKQTLVRGIAESEDAAALIRCLRELGATVEHQGQDAVVNGFGGSPRASRTLNVGNAGAVARFLMGITALTTGTTVVTDFPESLGRRPQGDLLSALEALGASVQSQGGRLPVSVSGPVLGGKVSVSAERSSQYASALMFLGPLLPRGLQLELTGALKSQGPLRQTLDTLATFGIEAEASADLRRISIAGGQTYQAREVQVPGDYPGAAAILSAAALLPGEVHLGNLRDPDLQGEREAVRVLQDMGADIMRDGDGWRVRGGQPLRAVVRDGDPFTDAVQALTAAAAFATGQTTWHNVATLRLKECDRISDTRRELERLGLQASETQDSLSVWGTSALAGGQTVSGHGDHRMIMLLTVLGLRAEQPIVITEAHHIRKSYPQFFVDLEKLGARFDYLPA